MWVVTFFVGHVCNNRPAESTYQENAVADKSLRAISRLLSRSQHQQYQSHGHPLWTRRSSASTYSTSTAFTSRASSIGYRPSTLTKGTSIMGVQTLLAVIVSVFPDLAAAVPLNSVPKSAASNLSTSDAPHCTRSPYWV